MCLVQTHLPPVVLNDLSVIHPLVYSALQSNKSMIQSASTYTFVYDREDDLYLW